MDESINYVEYLSEKIGGIQTKNPMRTVHLIPNIDLVPEPGFISQTPIQHENEQKLNWWCEKNKTSSDFWNINYKFIRMIKTYESFAKDIDSSIEYSEYVANNVNKLLDYMDSPSSNYSTSGPYSSSGNPPFGNDGIWIPQRGGSQVKITPPFVSTKTQEEIQNDKDVIYLGKSRIDGSSIYRKGDEIYNVKDNRPEPLAVSDLTTQTWNNDIWKPNLKQDKDMGWWTKNQDEEKLSKFQRLSIGIGIGTLIVGMISILIMFI